MTSILAAAVSANSYTGGGHATWTTSLTPLTALGLTDNVHIKFPAGFSFVDVTLGTFFDSIGVPGLTLGGGWNVETFCYQLEISGTDPQELIATFYSKDFAPYDLLPSGVSGSIAIDAITNAAPGYTGANFDVYTSQDQTPVHPTFSPTPPAPSGPVNQKAPLTMGVGL